MSDSVVDKEQRQRMDLSIVCIILDKGREAMTKQLPTEWANYWAEWQKNYDEENRKTWRRTLRIAIPMVLVLTAIVLWFGGWHAIAESLHLR